MDETLVSGPSLRKQMLEAEIEEFRQKNFELLRNNTRLERINTDAVLEVESLNELVRSKELQAKEKVIVEANREDDGHNSEEIINLERELNEARTTVEKLKSELDELKGQEKSQAKDAQLAADKLFEQIASFEIMKQTTDDIRLTLEEATKEKTELDLTNKYLGERLAELQVALEGKSSELRVLNTMQKELKDENALLSGELASLNSQPVSDTQRGKSLFAEVEGNRQVTRKNLQLMTMKCEEYKRLYASQCHEITALRSEKNRFKMSLLAADEMLESKFKELQAKYEESIAGFGQQIKELIENRPESPQIIPISENINNLKWVPIFVNEAREEADALRRKRTELELEILSLSNELHHSELQKQSLKKEVSKLELQIEDLNIKLEISEKVADKENAVLLSQPIKGVRFDTETKD